jgi:predicted Rdx family selenoprotein
LVWIAHASSTCASAVSVLAGTGAVFDIEGSSAAIVVAPNGTARARSNTSVVWAEWGSVGIAHASARSASAVGVLAGTGAVFDVEGASAAIVVAPNGTACARSNTSVVWAEWSSVEIAHASARNASAVGVLTGTGAVFDVEESSAAIVVASNGTARARSNTSVVWAEWVSVESARAGVLAVRAAAGAA